MIFIRHLDISHNCLICPSRLCTTFVFHFSWVLQPSQEKSNAYAKFFWGGGGGGREGGWLGGGIRGIMGNVQVTNPIGLANYHFSCSTLFLSREWQGCPINATAAGSWEWGRGEEERGGKDEMQLFSRVPIQDCYKPTASIAN